MNILKSITAACTMLFAWCSPATAQDWSKIYVDSLNYYTDIVFRNDSTGYAVGGYHLGGAGCIIKTTDAGATWSAPYYVNQELTRFTFLPIAWAMPSV